VATTFQLEPIREWVDAIIDNVSDSAFGPIPLADRRLAMVLFTDIVDLTPALQGSVIEPGPTS
jgi:hypothetical protein